MFVSALVAISLLASSAVAQTLVCGRNYTVVSGDTCDGISAAHSVSTYQLATVNPSINDACTNLQPGEDLCLGYTGSDCSITYTVVSGDTCDSVTSAQGINSTFLYMNNPQIDSACDNIYVGEVLCVANQVYILPQLDAASAGSPSGASTVPVVSTSSVPTLTPAAAVAPSPTTAVVTTTFSTPSSSATPSPTTTDDGDDEDCDEDDE